MAINKAMKLALKALSYPDLEISKFYKPMRAAQKMAKGTLSRIYKQLDRKIESNGREVTVRVYAPTERKSDKVLLFYHGGGWVAESIDTYNTVCLNLAKMTGCRVVSTEYALAPESPFPEGLEDCYAVAKEFFENPALFDTTAQDIILIGDSAGGNLSAAVSLMARDKGEFTVPAQILIYPATNNDHTENSPYKSVIENGTDYLLTSKHICEYMALYASEPEDFNNPYFAPLLSKDFSQQPKTLVITAEYDPLRDEGEDYGKKLEEAGNDVEIHRIPDVLHGFISLDIKHEPVRHTFELISNFIDRL